MRPSPLVQGVCTHVCRPPHGGLFESHFVSGPRVRDVLTFQGDVQGPAFVASYGHACQGRIHMEDGADGGCRCLSRFRIPRAQVHGAGDARTSQARSPIPTKLIPWLARHGAGLGSEGFGLVACRNHKAMGVQRQLSTPQWGQTAARWSSRLRSRGKVALSKCDGRCLQTRRARH